MIWYLDVSCAWSCGSKSWRIRAIRDSKSSEDGKRDLGIVPFNVAHIIDARMQMRNAQLINDLTSLHHFLVQLGHDGWWSLCIYSTSIYLYATIFNPHRSISKQEQTQRTHLRSCPWAAPWGPKKRPWRVFRSCCPREVCVVLGIGWRDSVHRVLGRYFTLGGRDYLASVDQWKLLKVNQRQYIYINNII